MKKTIFVVMVLLAGSMLWGCQASNTTSATGTAIDESKAGETIPSPPTPADPETSASVVSQ
jgi:predicted small secreted protein